MEAILAVMTWLSGGGVGCAIGWFYGGRSVDLSKDIPVLDISYHMAELELGEAIGDYAELVDQPRGTVDSHILTIARERIERLESARQVAECEKIAIG